MLNVGIIGCGRIADEHAAVVARLPGCAVVGVCDREPLMARQLAERFGVRRTFTDAAALVEDARPDVVHVTTPPESHYRVARQCLESGCHVYVEKPFTLTEDEARSLIECARERRLSVTVGHDAQFGRAARRMRELVRSGYLGSGPLHIETYHTYPLGDAYARALLGDPHHWVRRLPGQLLHNLISHGIARIAELLTTETPRVIARGFTSRQLARLGESDLVDELRVVIAEDSGTTAYFTFSSQMRPATHECRVFGSENGLALDPVRDTLVRLRGRTFPSFAEKFVPPADFAAQYLGNLAANLRSFLARDLQMKAGLQFLIRSFYRSIAEGTAPPIPDREILLTARIMDAIFAQTTRDRALTGQLRVVERTDGAVRAESRDRRAWPGARR